MGLAFGGEAFEEYVGVRIAAEQGCLEKQHAGVPYGCRAAEPRKNHLGDDGLNLKQQERGEEDGKSVEKHRAVSLSSHDREEVREGVGPFAEGGVGGEDLGVLL